MKLVITFIFSVFLGALNCCGSGVVWHTFNAFDFGSWVKGAWIIDSTLPYGPGIGFLGNGDVWDEACYTNDKGGAYWVYSFYGDNLCVFEDYLNREMAADVGYTQVGITRTGENLNGHEDIHSEGHTYLALIGYAGNFYSPDAPKTSYYAWIELDGSTVVNSALSDVGPLRIGTGELIPEPTAGVLFILGAAVLGLRRRRNRGVNSPLFAKSGE